MQTKKTSSKAGTNTAVKAITKGAEKSDRTLLLKLRRENAQLRNTMDDVWNVLCTIGPQHQSEEILEAFGTACHYMITDFPERYEYENSLLPQAEAPHDTLQFILAAQDRFRRRVSEKLGTKVNDLYTYPDFDESLAAWRKVFAEEAQLEAKPDSDVTEQEYRALVATYFSLTVLLFAKSPTTLKKEATRYGNVIAEMKALFPQQRRVPGKDVQIALEILTDDSKSFFDAYPQAIKKEYGYAKDYTDMSRKELTEAKRTLRKRVRAIQDQRKKATLKKGKVSS
jgi:hypothetical protein